MLQNLRQHSGGIFAKVLFGLIIASFALVGVGDMFHRYTKKPIATVGGTTIHTEEYDYRLKMVKDQIMASTKGKAKLEDIKAMGIPQKVLDDMINKNLEDHEMSALGIIVNDAVLENFVKSLPDFQNKRGEFDKAKFNELVTRAASKKDFFANVKNVLKKQQLFGTLSNSIRLPKAYQQDLYNAIHQDVVFSVVYVPESQVKVTASPTDADLEHIYKANPDQFTQPDYRDVSVLVIDPKAIQDKVAVSAEQIQEEYARRKQDFMTVETRDVAQLSFSSKEAAQTAHDELASGASLDKVIKMHKPKVQTFQKAVKDKFPAAQGNLIFALSHPGVTDMVESSLERAFFLFVVTEITPEGVQPLDTVHERLEGDLKSRLSHELVDDTRNKIEDELAGGKSFADLAAQFNLAVIKLGMMDETGFSPKKDSVFGEKTSFMKSIVLENANSMTEGSDSPVLDLSNGQMIVVRVDAIKPKVLPSLPDIRETVAKYWKDTQSQEKTAELSLEMIKEINEGAPVSQVAKKHGLKVRTLEPVSRASLQEKPFKDDVIGVQVLQRGFRQPLYRATYGPAKDGFAVIVPTKFVPHSADSKKETEKLAGFEQSLKGIIQKDFEQDYLRDLKTRFKVEINQSVIDSALGSGE